MLIQLIFLHFFAGSTSHRLLSTVRCFDWKADRKRDAFHVCTVTRRTGSHHRKRCWQCYPRYGSWRTRGYVDQLVQVSITTGSRTQIDKRPLMESCAPFLIIQKGTASSLCRTLFACDVKKKQETSYTYSKNLWELRRMVLSSFLQKWFRHLLLIGYNDYTIGNNNNKLYFPYDTLRSKSTKESL